MVPLMTETEVATCHKEAKYTDVDSYFVSEPIARENIDVWRTILSDREIRILGAE